MLESCVGYWKMVSVGCRVVLNFEIAAMYNFYQEKHMGNEKIKKSRSGSVTLCNNLTGNAQLRLIIQLHKKVD